ncbi:hypothetical protein U717_05785 [Rhodobacter capsulatus R121]|nr:hypothetical protein U714_05780 [Rhodobacter capsulatus DE442]ETD78525.1 hypothetical protein U717_05785 [Rhodobacter capsulatus R121]ETE54570.1 hypothetical protein U715_05780 [Rhodobacter capsulatus Y262]
MCERLWLLRRWRATLDVGYTSLDVDDLVVTKSKGQDLFVALRNLIVGKYYNLLFTLGKTDKVDRPLAQDFLGCLCVELVRPDLKVGIFFFDSILKRDFVE